ncbi:P-loop NTPase fold protein [Vibrio natriegens]|uniref:KAP family P-loop NTPase fold protein n=1 Tax=Vibrio natriegens TaxID=691 RepID=UPI003557C2B2
MLASQGYFNAVDGNKEKRNYVLNLNSEWGSGKTYFLRRWENSLKGHYPVVYIDAWKQDYSDDPLVTVITSIITQLREQAGRDEKDSTFSVPSKVVGLLKAAAPGLVRGFTKRYLDIDPVAIMNAEDDEKLPVVPDPSDPDGKPIDMSIAASQMVKHLLDEHSAKEKAIESLKTSVKQWVEAVVGLSEGKITYPAFIFVDELDRCRPSYAVEMLETIKHIFDLDGVVFVVATDTEQLQHTIKALYGNDFGARTYLGRFFNSRYTLKEPSYSKLLDAHCDVDKLTNEYLEGKRITVWPENGYKNDSGDELHNLISVYESMKLSARQVIQITERLIATIDCLPNGTFLDVIYLSFLLCLKEKFPHIFQSSQTHFLGGHATDSSMSKQMVAELTDSSYWNEREVTIHLNPREHMQEIPTGTRSTTENAWKQGYRGITLRNYIQMCHSHVKSNSSLNDQLRASALSNLAHTLHNRTQLNPDGNTLDWLNIIYGKLNRELGNGISFYVDLVELASALDHLGDEEE